MTEVMEVEIDPLSMLEQSMQVNDCSVNSEVDQDVVCLSDGSEDQPIQEIPRAAALAGNQESAPSVLLGTMPNGAVLLNPVSNDMTYVMTPCPLPEGVVDAPLDGGHFLGEHFLLDPGPSTSNAAPTPDSPPLIFISEQQSVRGRGYHRITRGTNRGRRGGVIHNGLTKPQLRPNQVVRVVSPMNPNIPTLNHNNNKVVEKDQTNTNKLYTNVRKLAYISKDEENYRIRMYKDFQKVVESKLDCTVCGTHIGCKKELDLSSVTHPLLKVLACSVCRSQYCCTDWTLGKDGRDFRCRWCSAPGCISRLLKFCKNCPFAFCESCISRNYPRGECSRIMKNINWTCFVCQMVPLYYLRATLWALGQYVSGINKKKTSEPNGVDHSRCCNQEIDLTNCVEDDEETESEDEVMQVSCLSVQTRLDVLFNNIDEIKQDIKTRLSKPVEYSKLEEFVSGLNFSLSKIGRTVDSGLEYVNSWRVHVSEIHRKEMLRKSDEKRKKVVIKTKNGDCGYKDLFKKFNIKPCSVVLERLDIWEETSRPPDFFLSLVKPADDKTTIIRADGKMTLNEKTITDNEIINVDEDDDDDVILVEN